MREAAAEVGASGRGLALELVAREEDDVRGDYC